MIVASDREPGLPYSKGLRASDLMVTGLSPLRAYQIAEEVEERLVAMSVDAISREGLNDLTEQVLLDLAGDRYAKNFRRWEEVRGLDVPIVLLIGGATGVGKSTIATRLAVRLNIVRVVATDAIREVMRATLTQELMPTLYTSSFQADAALREPPGRSQDTVIVGFREQTAAVSVGVNALLERAATEGTSAIIEGVHVVPGFIDAGTFDERILAIPVIVTVEDEELHRGHFAARAQDDRSSRPSVRYVRGFDNIRRVQRYIKSQALTHGVPVIANYSLDQMLSDLIDLVLDRATGHLRERRGGAVAGGDHDPAPTPGTNELEEARR